MKSAVARFILLFALTITVLQLQAETSEVSPQIDAPADVVVSCDYWFSLGMLYDPTNPMFGRMVYGQSNIQKLKTIDRVCPAWCERNAHNGYDPDRFHDGKACDFYNQYYSPAHPHNKYPLVWGWDGYVNGATSPIEIRVDDRRKCGTGLIIRQFSVVENGLRYSDEQRIWILDCDPFYVSDDCLDQNDHIEWPLFCQQPDPLDGCFANLDPSNPQLGRPKVVNGGDDHCNLISIDFQDDTITVEAGACLKVLRTWTVIDWCQYHPLRFPGQGRWEYLQIIKVRDKLDPEITCEIGECTPAFKDTATMDCVGYIELRAEGIDSCTTTDHLRFGYKIDLYNDGDGQFGTFDIHVGPFTKVDEVPDIQENDYAEFPDSVLNASGTYPIGEHRLKWFVEDGCGNVALCDTVFEIKDCKAPTPYCKTGIVTVVMPSSMEIAVWASDLDDGSFDNCSDDLIFSFSSDTTEQSRIFDCDEIGQHEVEIWVTDEEGNQDLCKTTIEIQDPNDICPNNVVNGTVLAMSSGESLDMAGAELQLFDDGHYVRSEILTSNTFSLNIGDIQGEPSIRIVFNANALNGVTTSDALMIYRILLGKEDWHSVEERIAADVNGDCRISVGDAAMITKVLLGKLDDFTSRDINSYVFLPVNMPGFDMSTYCGADSRLVIDRQNMLPEYQFIPLKMGDLR